MLVRAGAIRFMSRDKNELWGLLERTEASLGVTQVDREPKIEGPVFGEDSRPEAVGEAPQPQPEAKVREVHAR